MKQIRFVTRPAAVLLLGLFVIPAHAAAWDFNLTKGVTAITHELWDLHMFVFWICVVIGIGVFGVMLYSVIRHRKSRGAEAAHFHENTAIEVTWTIIPFIILVVMAIPAAGTLLKIEDSTGADLTIRVTGYQWLWEYKYIDSGVHFYSRLSDSSMRARALESVSPYEVDHYLLSVTNRLVVPVDKKVRLLLTSGDVIHAWWVPKLGGKKDAIPGYINDMWFKAQETGVYRGQCTELCGRGHGFMPIVVEVVTQEQFKAWIAKKTKMAKQSSSKKAVASSTGETGKTAAGQAQDGGARTAMQSESGADESSVS